MGLKLFPTKEYSLKSHCTSIELINALEANVMIPDDLTITILSKVADERKGIRRYFEGTVNGNEFTINHRSYNYASPSAGISFMPQIYGMITETKEGADIKIVFTSSTPSVILLIFFLPIFIIAKVFAPGNLIILLIIFSVFFLIAHLVYYRYRIQEDKEQLKLIFKAEETEYHS